MVIVFLLVFTVTVLPVSIAFYAEDQLNPAWLSVNIIVDSLFLTDIVVTFRTGIVSTSEPEGVSQWSGTACTLCHIYVCCITERICIYSLKKSMVMYILRRFTNINAGTFLAQL